MNKKIAMIRSVDIRAEGPYCQLFHGCKYLHYERPGRRFCMEFTDNHGDYLPLNLDGDGKRPVRCPECIEAERIANAVGLNEIKSCDNCKKKNNCTVTDCTILEIINFIPNHDPGAKLLSELKELIAKHCDRWGKA